MISESIYNEKYPGCYVMKFHDSNSELARWFDNYKLDKYASFASRYEWLTIEEQTTWTHRGRSIIRYVGTIGDDHSDNERTIRFEVGAPPPPSFMMPVRAKWEPRPPPLESVKYSERRAEAYYQYKTLIQKHMFSVEEIRLAERLPPVDPPKPRWIRNN